MMSFVKIAACAAVLASAVAGDDDDVNNFDCFKSTCVSGDCVADSSCKAALADAEAEKEKDKDWEFTAAYYKSVACDNDLLITTYECGVAKCNLPDYNASGVCTNSSVVAENIDGTPVACATSVRASWMLLAVIMMVVAMVSRN